MRLATLFLLLATFAAHADDILLINGKTLAGVTISRVEPDGLVAMTDDGITKIPFSWLPADTAKRYGYDPAKAAQFNSAVRAAASQRAAEEAAANQAAAVAAAPAPPQNANELKIGSLEQPKPPGVRTGLDRVATAANRKFTLWGKVFQSLDKGLLIEVSKSFTPEMKSGQIVYLTGYPGENGLAEGAVVKCSANENGVFKYGDNGGSGRTVKALVFLSK